MLPINIRCFRRAIGIAGARQHPKRQHNQRRGRRLLRMQHQVESLGVQS